MSFAPQIELLHLATFEKMQQVEVKLYTISECHVHNYGLALYIDFDAAAFLPM